MNRLKQKRTEKGLTQSELAESAGVSLRMIQHYEQGFKDINKAQAITAIRIADALGCDVRDIMNEENAEN